MNGLSPSRSHSAKTPVLIARRTRTTGCMDQL
jgi:hypothetical protein